MDHASSKSAEEWVEIRNKKWGFASIFIGSKTKQQQNKKEKQEKKTFTSYDYSHFFF